MCLRSFRIENCYESLTGNRLTGPEISKLANDGDMQAKDVMFSIFILMLVFLLYEVLIYQDNIKHLQVVALVLLLIMSILYRNNFIYVLFLFIPIFILFNLKNIFSRKNIIICVSFIVALICGMIIKGPIYDTFGVERGYPIDAMISIPSAQIARSAQYDQEIREKLNRNNINSEALIYAYVNGQENCDNFMGYFRDAIDKMENIQI